MSKQAEEKPISKILFEKYDVNGNGAIDAEEFRSLCYDKGHPISSEEATLIISRLDTNGDSEIEYEEFMLWWNQQDRYEWLSLSEEERVALTNASTYFQFFDKDRSGCIDSKEFPALYSDLVKNGYGLGSLQDSFNELDIDNSGTISLTEFIRFLIKNGELARFKKSNL